LPSTIVRGKKRGFTPPLPVWLKEDLRDFVSDVLSPPRIEAMGFFRPQAVSQILADHFAGRKDNNRPIWTLLCIVLWYENLRSTTS
jgi:asparagine synthase (glutamine-hydrolysing)